MNRSTKRKMALVAVALSSLSAASLHAQVLKGSQASIERMFNHAVNNKFEFHETPASVRDAVANGALVELSGNSDYIVHAVKYPFVMPASRLFVERLGSQYRAACKEQLVVTSAVRPETMKLRNASDQSVHSTGMAVDLRSSNIPQKCRKYLDTTLTSLERTGVIEVTRETKPPHFHVAVFPAAYRNYVAALTRNANTSVASKSSAIDTHLMSYEVRNGDSLWGIAVKHDTTVQAIQDLNKLRGNTIHPGQILVVPSQSSSGSH